MGNSGSSSSGSSLFNNPNIKRIGQKPWLFVYKSNLKDNIIDFLTFGMCETDKCNKLSLCIGIISILMIILAFVLLGIGISEIVKNKPSEVSEIVKNKSYRVFYAFIIPFLYILLLLFKKFVIKKKLKR